MKKLVSRHSLLGLVALTLVCFTIISLEQKGLLRWQDVSIQAGEVDLSGNWKIRFGDHPKYANAKIDDSAWCLISVPQSSQRALPSKDDHPAKDCPQQAYPKKQMTQGAYWYRKTFALKEDAPWIKPSLFLGTVRQQGDVYLDGDFIGTVRKEQTPAILVLSSTQLKAGTHVLAIRAESQFEENPGIVHRYPRKVALGAYNEALKSISANKQLLFENHFALVLQLLALFVLLYLAFRSKEVGEDFFWLSLYFGGSALYIARADLPQPFHQFFLSFSLTSMSCALAGYSVQAFENENKSHPVLKRVVLLFGFLFALGSFALLAEPNLNRGIFSHFGVIVIGLSLLCTVGLCASYLLNRLTERKSSGLQQQQVAILVCTILLHIVLLMKNSAPSSVTSFLHTPLISAAFTVAIVLLAIDRHVTQQRTLSFFGRFIRPGLRSLLLQNKEQVEEREHFRGRKIPVMKIDIVCYSDTTFGMPYGMKRLFQHLWFTHVDRVVNELTFFDKPEGDGSIYFFRENIEGGSCRAVLDVIKKICSEVIPAFDQEFKIQLQELLRTIPELRKPSEAFFNRYLLRNGHTFMDRSTRARFACVFGHADEGLWGMLAKSHYDVQGDLLILLARIEKQANESQIVMDQQFVEQLHLEGHPNMDQLQHHENLFKGIGNKKYAILDMNELSQTSTLKGA